MKSERSIEISRRIEDVFRMTHEDAMNWSNYVVESEMLDGGPPRIGSRFRIVTEDRGRRMSYQGVIKAYDPPYAFATELTGEHFDVDSAYAFENLGYRTKVTQFSDVTGRGLSKFVFAILGWMMHSAFQQAQDKELTSLKQYCESQPD